MRYMEKHDLCLGRPPDSPLYSVRPYYHERVAMPLSFTLAKILTFSALTW